MPQSTELGIPFMTELQIVFFLCDYSKPLQHVGH